MTGFLERERARLAAEADAVRRQSISLSDLATAFRLSRSRIRQIGLPVFRAGTTGSETLFCRDGVRAHLAALNGRPVDLPEDDLLMTPREVCLALGSRGTRVTPGLLAQWRKRSVGPAWIRVGGRTIRYRQSGLVPGAPTPSRNNAEYEFEDDE